MRYSLQPGVGRTLNFQVAFAKPSDGAEGGGSPVELGERHRRRSEKVSAADAMAYTALGLFWVSLWLTMFFVKLAIGPLPIRTIFLGISGALLIASSPQDFVRALVTARIALLAVGYACVLGVLGSIWAHATIAQIVRAVIEIHIQSATMVLVATMLIMRFTIRPVLYALVTGFLLSALVAFGQALHFDFAWDLRAWAGNLMNDPPLTRDIYTRRERALGLNFSPVHFAADACLTLAAVCYLRWSRLEDLAELRRFDPVIGGTVVLVIMGCVATGNRSPILGVLLFGVGYFIYTQRKLALLLTPLLAMSLPGAMLVDSMPFRSESISSIRVIRTDSSSENRTTLMAFGSQLVRERPWGYGLNFDSTEHWQNFIHEARYLSNPLSIRKWALHNYYLNLICKYGIAIIALIFIIFPYNLRQFVLIAPFSALAIHQFFHNEGILNGDLRGLVLIAAFPFILLGVRSAPPLRRWNSAFPQVPNAVAIEVRESA